MFKVSTFTNSLIAIILTGCMIQSEQSNQAPDNLDLKFSATVPISEMNTYISVTIDSSSQRYFRNASSINFYVRNKSKDVIVFPPDYGIRFFAFYNNNWEEIQNVTPYINSKSVNLSPKNIFSSESDWQRLITASPYSPNIKNLDVVRLLVLGKAQRDDPTSTIPVGAFVEFTLQR